MLNNKNNAFKIDSNNLSIEQVDINELVLYYKNELIKKDILQEYN